jgi:hypothetical protein
MGGSGENTEAEKWGTDGGAGRGGEGGEGEGGERREADKEVGRGIRRNRNGRIKEQKGGGNERKEQKDGGNRRERRRDRNVNGEGQEERRRRTGQ